MESAASTVQAVLLLDPERLSSLNTSLRAVANTSTAADARLRDLIYRRSRKALFRYEFLACLHELFLRLLRRELSVRHILVPFLFSGCIITFN